MSETPKIPSTAPSVARAAQPAPSASKSTNARPAFEALFERLTTRAAELEEKSKTLATPAELSGAVDTARASLEDALTLGEKLLEAYRAARSTGGASEVKP